MSSPALMVTVGGPLSSTSGLLTLGMVGGAAATVDVYAGRQTSRQGRGRKAVRPLRYGVDLHVALEGPSMPSVAGVVQAIAPQGPSLKSQPIFGPMGERLPAHPAFVPPPAPKQQVRAAHVTMTIPILPEWRIMVGHRDVEGEAVQSLIQMIQAYD